MFKMPEDILNFFFQEIHSRGKYDIVYEDNVVKIKPVFHQKYYKPIIIISNLEKLKESLTNYVYELNRFYESHNNLEHYHDLSFFFNNLFLNMTASDANDFISYVDRRSFFFSNKQFMEYRNPTLLKIEENMEFYVQQILESPGLETPFILSFKVIVGGNEYPLPLVRCAFDENNVCHLFAIQFGRGRDSIVQNEDYKRIVNKMNSGVNKYRNVSPSFVLTFKLFLSLLEKYDIHQIQVPDFLFGRYRNYYRAQTTKKSNAILSRILDRFLLLMQRMEYQFQGFEIVSFPNEIDSYTHINLNGEIKDKKILKQMRLK